MSIYIRKIKTGVKLQIQNIKKGFIFKNNFFYGIYNRKGNGRNKKNILTKITCYGKISL